MKRTSDILWAAPLALACLALSAGTALAETPAARMQKVLDTLSTGNIEQAQFEAISLTQQPNDFGRRAWLVVAAARQNTGAYGPARQAYRIFLATCTSPQLRDYAVGQIKACDDAQNRLTRVAPTQKLSHQQRADLALLAPDIQTQRTEHFVVHSRNAALAKLLAEQAEIVLDHITHDLMGGQAYPNVVEINVWADHKDYLAHAADAPEWSGGSFSFSNDGDTVSRRIDLTQLDDDGKFARVMLDRVLPHEMCHLVLREYFGDAPCPLFLNEGLAMLAEYAVDDNRTVLAGAALAGPAKIDLDKLILRQRRDLPDVTVFYAESYSFLSFLQSRLTESQFRDLLQGVKDGCTFNDALQRALYIPSDTSLLKGISRAWTDYAQEQAQYARAINGKELTLSK